MGYFEYYDVPPGSMDQELYERIYNRFVKLYPEAAESGFEPTYSGHDSDWDRIWEEEELRYEQEKYHDGTSDKNQSTEGEYEDEAIYGPPAPPKKKKKKKKAEESVEPVENCFSSENPNANKCLFRKFACFYDDGNGGNDEIKFYDDSEERLHYEDLTFLCDNQSRSVHSLQLNTIAPKGPCDDHADRVFYVYGSNFNVITQNDSQLSIEFFSTHNDDEADIFYNMMLGHKPESFRVVIGQCGTHEEVVVNVLPKYEFQLSLSVAFSDKAPREIGPKSEYADGPKSKPKDGDINEATHTKGQPKISIKRTFNGHTTDWGAKFGESTLKNIQEVERIVDGLFEFINKYFSSFAKLTVKMPVITGEGQWSYASNGAYGVKRVGQYDLQLKPLIGVEFEISILKAGGKVFGAVGLLLELASRVKDWTKGHVEVALDVTVKLFGGISANCLQKFGEQEKGYSINVKSSMQVTITVIAQAHLEAYIFKVAASGSAYADSSIGTTISVTQLLLPKGSLSCDFSGVDVGLKGKYDVGIGWLTYENEYECKYTVVEGGPVFDPMFFDLN